MTVNTQYDLLNRPLSVLYASTNTGVTYGYDNAGRMLSETNTMPAASQTLTYAYDHAGNKTSITYPDSAAFTYGYDGMNRFVWGGNAGSNPATDVGVNFDTLGRVSWVGRNHVGGTAYGYDLADRVTKVQIENNNGQLWSWSYNPAGQVVTKSSSNSAYDQRPPANDNEAHTYDGLNRDAAVTAVSGYDANQNLTTDPVGARSFTYDAENKLVAASGSGTSAAVSLSYDPLGRLYQEVATSGGSSTTTQFLYSGDKLVAEYNGAGVMQGRYLHGPSEDQPLIQYGGSSVDGTTAQFLYTDRQGSVVALENTAGTVQTPFTYGPYGEPASWGGTRFAYTGQIELPEARLYHYKARVYDPSRGAFNQTDPIGYKDNLNLYGYVKEDPLNGSDPLGLSDVTVVVYRDESSKTGTTGTFFAYSSADGVKGASGRTLEPPSAPDKNVNQTSRVEPGTYTAQERSDGHLGDRLELTGAVPGTDGTNHTNIEVHPGNTEANSKGCILAGTSDGAKNETLTSSRAAVSAIMGVVHDTRAVDAKSGDKTTIHVQIIDPPKPQKTGP